MTKDKLNCNLVVQIETGRLTVPFCASDIDECSQSPEMCTFGTCLNNEGSFTCSCPDGFQLSASGRRCLGNFVFIFCYFFAMFVEKEEAVEAYEATLCIASTSGDEAAVRLFLLFHDSTLCSSWFCCCCFNKAKGGSEQITFPFPHSCVCVCLCTYVCFWVGWGRADSSVREFPLQTLK